MKTYKRRTIQRMSRVMVGECEHDVKVTRLGDGYNIRVFLNNGINQESRVYDKQHIGTEIQDMLRMEDKCGNISSMASNSRFRKGRKESSRKEAKNLENS